MYKGHKGKYKTNDEVTLELNLINAKLISHHIKNNTLLFSQQHDDKIQYKWTPFTLDKNDLLDCKRPLPDQGVLVSNGDSSG